MSKQCIWSADSVHGGSETILYDIGWKRDTVSNMFSYLGSITQNDGEIDFDVKHMAKVGWLKWKKATDILCDHKFH